MRWQLIFFFAISFFCIQKSFAQLKLPEPDTNEFHFVVLGDAQFDDAAKFNRIIDQSRALGPAFVIQVGDLIDGYKNDLGEVKQEWQRFKKQVAPLDEIPFLPLPGNHDVYNAEVQIDPKLEALYEDNWGPLYYAFEYKNALFVTLNSDSSDAANRISGKQLKWLTQKLAQSTATHKFVFMHRPPALLKNAEAMHTLFKGHGVSHVFYGHHHHYHHLRRDGVTYTMTNAAGNSVRGTNAQASDAVGSFHHLLQVSVRADNVEIAVIKADSIVAKDSVYPVDNYDFFALTQYLSKDSTKLQKLAPGHYALHIPLKNRAKRDVRLHVSCHSADQRWLFEPEVIAPIALAAGQQLTLQLEASYAEKRVPESAPTCTITAPFQTHHGHWIEFRKTVTGVVTH